MDDALVVASPRVKEENVTAEEKRAVAALKRLARVWPKSLVLVQHTDSPCLAVKSRSDTTDDDPARGEALVSVRLTVLVCA